MVVAAFFIMVVMWGTVFTFGIFFKSLLVEFGWTRVMTSGAFSLFMVVHGLLGIVTGKLNDRFGPRIIITVCGFFLGLGYLLMSQVSAVWQLYLFSGVLVGIGVSGGFVPLTSTVARWFVERRGLMTGVVLTGVGTGTMVMPPLARWLIFTYDWRTSFVIVGSIALIFVILAAQFLRRDPSQVGQLPYGENEVRQVRLPLEARGFSLREAIHIRQFWMLCAMYLCFGLCVQTIMVHIVIYVTGLEISAAIAATILTVIGGLSIVSRMIMGGASDRIGNKLALTISFIVMFLALFWLVVAKEIWALYLFAVAFGFAYGGLSALESPIVAELFGLGSHGAILGIVAFSFTAGGAIGPVMSGHIFDITGSYYLAFLVCTIASVIGLILTSLLKPISRGSFATN